MSLWKKIAKNEFRLATYRFRKNRRLFFLYLISGFTYWGFYFGPNLLNILLPQFLSYYAYLYADVLVLYFEYFFALIFLLNILLPLYNLYQKKENKVKEIILKLPIKPKDIFLGKFVWKIPFYILFVLFIGPFFTSLLGQLRELTLFHIIIIYLCIFALLIFSQLIGIVISNFVDYKLSNSQKALNFRKIRILAIALILIIIYFLIRFLSTLYFSSPELRNWLIIFPSFWYSTIIIYLIYPTMASLNIYNIWIIIFLAIAIPIIIFIFTYKNSNKFYVVRRESNLLGLNTEKSRSFYNLLRKITLKKWRGLVQTHFKEFFRNEDYMLKFFYTIIINVIFGVVLALSLSQFEFEVINDLQIYKILEIVIISWIGSILFGTMSGAYIFFESKSLLITYKKSLRGPKALIYSIFYFLIFLIVLIDLVSVSVFTFIFNLDIFTVLIFILVYFFLNLIITVEMIGIQCLKPVFKDRKSITMINAYILILLQVISLFLSLLLFIPNVFEDLTPSLALLFIFLIHFGISSGIGSLLFFVGIKRINKYE